MPHLESVTPLHGVNKQLAEQAAVVERIRADVSDLLLESHEHNGAIKAQIVLSSAVVARVAALEGRFTAERNEDRHAIAEVERRSADRDMALSALVSKSTEDIKAELRHAAGRDSLHEAELAGVKAEIGPLRAALARLPTRTRWSVVTVFLGGIGAIGKVAIDIALAYLAAHGH